MRFERLLFFIYMHINTHVNFNMYKVYKQVPLHVASRVLGYDELQ